VGTPLVCTHGSADFTGCWMGLRPLQSSSPTEPGGTAAPPGRMPQAPRLPGPVK
jgi:hypothetical protein